MNLLVHKLSVWLSNGHVTVIFGVIYFASQLTIGLILEHVGPEEVLRLQTTFSTEHFVQIIEQWQSAGKLPSYGNHFYFDFIHPLWYSVFLSSLMAKTMNANSFGNRYASLLLIPFVAGFSDLIENSIHVYFLSDMNRVSVPLVMISAFFSNLKWLLCEVSLLFVILMGIKSMIAKTR